MKERNVVLILMLAIMATVGVASGQNYLVRVNFQLNTYDVSALPDGGAGYVADVGETFADRGTDGGGWSYGWSASRTDRDRNRNKNHALVLDERYDTLVHMDNGEIAKWEIAVPDGVYNLFILAGDANNNDQTNNLDVEGTIVNDPTPYDGNKTNDPTFDEYTLTGIVVADGRLTVDAGAGYDNPKLCFIDISFSDPTFNPPPAVNAGSDLSIWLGDEVRLAGTVTDLDPGNDPGSGTLTFYWKLDGGPGTVTFDPSDTTDVLDPLVKSFSAAGTYELMLQATDGEKDSNDIVSILVRDPALKDELAHWDFEDIIPGSNTIPEEYGNDGTYVNDWDRTSLAPTVVEGIIGDYALRFNGAREHMLNPFVLPKEYGTLSHWCRTATDDQQGIYFEGNEDESNGYGGDPLEIHSGSNGGKWMFSYCDNASENNREIEGGKAVIGVWSHVVATWNIYGELILYVNGIEVDSATIGDAGGGFLEPTENNSLIGGVSEVDHSRMYDGDVDEVQVFNWDMTPEEIRALTALADVPPDVDAGPDFETMIRLSTKIVLDEATLVDYGAPTEPTILWEVVEGPGEVAFTDDGVLNAEVQFGAFGDYVLSVTASDAGGSDTSEIDITIVETDCSDVLDDGLILTGDIAGGGVDGDEPDCRVNLTDVAAFAADFLSCNNPQDDDCEDPYL